MKRPKTLSIAMSLGGTYASVLHNARALDRERRQYGKRAAPVLRSISLIRRRSGQPEHKETYLIQ